MCDQVWESLLWLWSGSGRADQKGTQSIHTVERRQPPSDLQQLGEIEDDQLPGKSAPHGQEGMLFRIQTWLWWTEVSPSSAKHHGRWWHHFSLKEKAELGWRPYSSGTSLLPSCCSAIYRVWLPLKGQESPPPCPSCPSERWRGMSPLSSKDMIQKLLFPYCIGQNLVYGCTWQGNIISVLGTTSPAKTSLTAEGGSGD